MVINASRSYLIHSEEMTSSIQASISWHRMDYSVKVESSLKTKSDFTQNSKVGISQAIERPVDQLVDGNILNPIFLPVEDHSDDFTENSWKLIGKILPCLTLWTSLIKIQAILSKSKYSVQRNQIQNRLTPRKSAIFPR